MFVRSQLLCLTEPPREHQQGRGVHRSQLPEPAETIHSGHRWVCPGPDGETGGALPQQVPEHSQR